MVVYGRIVHRRSPPHLDWMFVNDMLTAVQNSVHNYACYYIMPLGFGLGCKHLEPYEDLNM